MHAPWGTASHTWLKYKAVTVLVAFLFRGVRLLVKVGMGSFWEGLLVMNTEPPCRRCSWIRQKSTSCASWTSTSRLASFLSSMVWNVCVFSLTCISSRNILFSPSSSLGQSYCLSGLSFKYMWLSCYNNIQMSSLDDLFLKKTILTLG